MLDLEATIHLQKIKVTLLVEQKLYGASVLVFRKFTQSPRRVVNGCAELGRQIGCRRLLNNFLVIALERTVAVAEDETLRALDDLVTAGKVRYTGCCNFSAADVVEAAWTAKTKNLTPFISAQNRHNVIECRIPAELASACERHGLGLLPYYPLAAGLLTGKYRASEPPPPGTRLATPSKYYDGILCEKNFARLAKLEAFARERDRSIVELAIGWLASQRIVSSVICGATRPEQIEMNVRESGWRLTGEEMAAIDALLEIQ